MTALTDAIETVTGALPHGIRGRASEVRGLSVLVDELPVPIGSLVSIEAHEGLRLAEVVGFAGDRSIAMPLGSTAGVRPGDDVWLVRARQRAMVGRGLIGRVINGLGEPIDGGPEIRGLRWADLNPPPVGAMGRPPVRQAMRTGVRVIDLMTPMGRGQRLGVFAGAGVGKSTLMAQVAKHSDADVSVIALVGERGREVREFVEDALGDAGLARSVVVVATGDESPTMRVRAARLACTAAEAFRDEGMSVMLMMDSATRFAHAQRQIGLSAGEPPATKGYTPSVFAELARLLERAGPADDAGSVTALFTVLVDGDDLTEPIADAARGILDGHLVLSRKLAQRGHFPAVDVLASVSRVADAISDGHEIASRRQIARLLGKHAEVEELVQIGAYASGSDAETDTAIDFKPAIDALLTQGSNDRRAYAEDRDLFVKIAVQTGEDIQRRAATRGIGG